MLSLMVRPLVALLMMCVFSAALPGQGATGRVGLIAFERDDSIYVMRPDGSELRLLAKKFGREPGEGDGYLSAPAFTPDGSQITYSNGGRTTHQSVSVRPAEGGRRGCTRSSRFCSTRRSRSHPMAALPSCLASSTLPSVQPFTSPARSNGASESS